jgi:hypothetical protein
MAEKEEYIIPEGNMHDVYTLLIVHNFTPEDFNRTEQRLSSGQPVNNEIVPIHR